MASYQGERMGLMNHKAYVKVPFSSSFGQLLSSPDRHDRWSIIFIAFSQIC